MRYESFYPFSNNQSPPMRQPGFGPIPFMQPSQNPGQSPGFNRPNQPFPSAPAAPAGEQGPSKIDAYMQTANRFLNTAQQFAPVAQQFAPMVRNLPAMWRLYKGFQSIPTAGAGGAAASQAVSGAARTTAGAAVQSSLPSTPRIFQPPSR